MHHNTALWGLNKYTDWQKKYMETSSERNSLMGIIFPQCHQLIMVIFFELCPLLLIKIEQQRIVCLSNNLLYYISFFFNPAPTIRLNWQKTKLKGNLTTFIFALKHLSCLSIQWNEPWMFDWLTLFMRHHTITNTFLYISCLINP